jgi:hypothetical protein
MSPSPFGRAERLPSSRLTISVFRLRPEALRRLVQAVAKLLRHAEEKAVRTLPGQRAVAW